MVCSNPTTLCVVGGHGSLVGALLCELVTVDSLTGRYCVVVYDHGLHPFLHSPHRY